MNNTKKQTIGVHTLVGVGLLTAIVVVLQLLGSFIRFGPFSISLVLLPIVVGAATYGTGAGAWLGFAFGATVLLSGDAAAFLTVDPIGTVLVVLLKGMLAGLLSGLVYRLLSRRSRYLSVAISAIVCPIINTGIFLLGCRLFFFDTIAGWAEAAGFSGGAGLYLIVVMVGLNFIVELLINVILAPAVVRILTAIRKN